MFQTVLKEDTLLISKILRVLRCSYKLTLFLLTMAHYFLIAGLFFPVRFVFPQWGNRVILKMIQCHARWCLFFMGIHVQLKGRPDDSQGHLLVGNHLSYLDALILAAYSPGHFVTSVEIKNTPVLGQICVLGGCLFVERRSRSKLSFEVEQLKLALSDSRRVIVFPEGTSTNGDTVFRFKRPLFQAALDSSSDVYTFCLNYLSIDQQKVDVQNRDLICWYGDMAFFSHLCTFLSTSHTEVELRFNDTKVSGGDVESLSLNSHQQVFSSFASLNGGQALAKSAELPHKV